MRRGVVQVGPVTARRTDPLSLLRWDERWSPTAEMLVLPRMVDVESLGLGYIRDQEGTPSDEISMSDLAFHALREYVPGDDLRHVHWRSSAKADTLQIRQYQDTRRSHLTVVIDDDSDSYADPEDFETAVSAAASIAARAHRDGVDLSMLCGQHAVTGRGLDGVLDACCRIEPGDLRPGAGCAGGDAARTADQLAGDGDRGSGVGEPGGGAAFRTGARRDPAADPGRRCGVDHVTRPAGARLVTLRVLDELRVPSRPPYRVCRRDPAPGVVLVDLVAVLLLVGLAVVGLDTTFRGWGFLVVGRDCRGAGHAARSRDGTAAGGGAGGNRASRRDPSRGTGGASLARVRGRRTRCPDARGRDAGPRDRLGGAADHVAARRSRGAARPRAVPAGLVGGVAGTAVAIRSRSAGGPVLPLLGVLVGVLLLRTPGGGMLAWHPWPSPCAAIAWVAFRGLEFTPERVGDIRGGSHGRLLRGLMAAMVVGAALLVAIPLTSGSASSRGESLRGRIGELPDVTGLDSRSATSAPTPSRTTRATTPRQGAAGGCGRPARQPSAPADARPV